ncbi:hypothetical protein PAXRUDRAFT_22581 [Paxillus rubicundulus Ve08.2h10]|uniref:Uncharacterized protein n=1 Tax=Paxillus rubicundulus Ve08.2h10 TaxID=930991 RepID=A0A0D0CXA8_9AGAM|nr:hypothetical protein PAXRUDRAFT_22581 [Paxillus rubicundulus Ve08.2h10]
MHSGLSVFLQIPVPMSSGPVHLIEFALRYVIFSSGSDEIIVLLISCTSAF